MGWKGINNITVWVRRRSCLRSLCLRCAADWDDELGAYPGQDADLPPVVELVRASPSLRRNVAPARSIRSERLTFSTPSPPPPRRQQPFVQGDPPEWFHDVFYSNGTAYREAEVRAFRAVACDVGDGAVGRCAGFNPSVRLGLLFSVL